MQTCTVLLQSFSLKSQVNAYGWEAQGLLALEQGQLLLLAALRSIWYRLGAQICMHRGC